MGQQKFVNVRNPETGSVGKVPERALDHWVGKGFEPLDAPEVVKEAGPVALPDPEPEVPVFVEGVDDVGLEDDVPDPAEGDVPDANPSLAETPEGEADGTAADSAEDTPPKRNRRRASDAEGQ